MFSWLKRSGARGQQPEAIRTVTSALKELYRSKLLPLEEHYRFGAFHSPALEDADFDGKPMVLVAGQYSTGKTSFIQYLLEQEVPGSRVGPEPTTDCFVAVMHGDTEGTVPGNALVVDPDKPFRKLNPFGNTFLNRCGAGWGGLGRGTLPLCCSRGGWGGARCPLSLCAGPPSWTPVLCCGVLTAHLSCPCFCRLSLC